VRIWLGVCNRLSKAGITRLPGEGASAFAARAAKALPKAAASLKRISECYNELRYGATQPTLDELKLAVKEMPSVSNRDRPLS
jgi:protein-glutamine gamma-glutamyltransferase